MTKPEDIPKPVVDAIVKRLRPAPGSLQIDEATESFPWAKDHRIWVGYNHLDVAATVAFDGASPPALLTGDDLAPLARLLVAERGSLSAFSPTELALAVRRLTRSDPTGYLGDEGVLYLPVMRRREPSDPKTAELEQTRKAAAVAPRFATAGPETTHPGARMLEFSYWRKDGGIDAWSVELRPTGFGEPEVRELAPKGSYLYAFC